MSNQVNTNLLEQARYWAEECAGTSLGAQIDMALSTKDLDYLAVLVKQAEDYHRYIDLVNDDILETARDVRDELGDIY